MTLPPENSKEALTRAIEALTAERDAAIARAEKAEAALREADDGRPMQTDLFLAAMVANLDDQLFPEDVLAAVVAWVEGAWGEALFAARLPLPENGGENDGA